MRCSAPGLALKLHGFLQRQTPILALAVVLFLATASVAMLLASQCIEGGLALGFPAPFYGGCNSSPNVPSPRTLYPLSIALDLVVWYMVSWGVLTIVRERRGPRSP